MTDSTKIKVAEMMKQINSALSGSSNNKITFTVIDGELSGRRSGKRFTTLELVDIASIIFDPEDGVILTFDRFDSNSVYNNRHLKRYLVEVLTSDRSLYYEVDMGEDSNHVKILDPCSKETREILAKITEMSNSGTDGLLVLTNISIAGETYASTHRIFGHLNYHEIGIDTIGTSSDDPINLRKIPGLVKHCLIVSGDEKNPKTELSILY